MNYSQLATIMQKIIKVMDLLGYEPEGMAQMSPKAIRFPEFVRKEEEVVDEEYYPEAEVTH